MSGGVSLDTNDRYNLINAGDLYINDIKITPEQNANSQFVYSSNQATTVELDKIYGKNNQIKLVKDNVNVINQSLFIPKNIIMTNIVNCSTGEALATLKQGYKLTWNADNTNKDGVVIEILGTDNAGVERYSYLLVADNGYYIFSDDNLNLYPKSRNPFGLEITLIRGNFLFLRGTDNRRYNFNFVTTCSYLFKL